MTYNKNKKARGQRESEIESDRERKKETEKRKLPSSKNNYFHSHSNTSVAKIINDVNPSSFTDKTRPVLYLGQCIWTKVHLVILQKICRYLLPMADGMTVFLSCWVYFLFLFTALCCLL